MTFPPLYNVYVLFGVNNFTLPWLLCLVFYLLISNLFLTSPWSLDFTIDTHSSGILSIFSLSCCFQRLLTCQSQLVCVCVCVRVLSRVQLLGTLWTVAHHAPLSVEFSWWECWSGLPFPPPGNLPDPGIKPASLVSPALAGRNSLPLHHMGSKFSNEVFFHFPLELNSISWIPCLLLCWFIFLYFDGTSHRVIFQEKNAWEVNFLRCYITENSSLYSYASLH